MSGAGHSSGGGYIADSQGSTSSPGGRRMGAATLRPVTILQLQNATQEHGDSSEFICDGHELTQFTFVGQVVNAVANPVNVVMEFIDGTGGIQVRQWVESKEEGEALVASIPLMSWARVLASMKTFNDRKQLTAAKTLPVTEPNEIYYHKLEALQAHLYFTQGLGDDTTMADGSKPHRGAPSAYTSGGSGAGGASDEYGDLTSMQRKVLMFIKNNAVPNDGASITDIAQGVRGDGATATAISEAIDYLQDNGHIYQTIDDDHYVVS